MKKPAFTLVELILYISIASSMVVILLLFSIQMLERRSESQVKRELLENARFALNLISQEIRDAEAVSSGSFGAHPGSLTLDADGAATWALDTDTKTVGSTTTRYLQVNTGSGPQQITSDLVNVSNLVITNLTRDSEPSNLQIELTLETLDGSESASYQTAVSLRES